MLYISTYLLAEHARPGPVRLRLKPPRTGTETRAVDSFGLSWLALIRPRRLTRLSRLSRLWTIVRERIAAIEPFSLSTR